MLPETCGQQLKSCDHTLMAEVSAKVHIQINNVTVYNYLSSEACFHGNRCMLGHKFDYVLLTISVAAVITLLEVMQLFGSNAAISINQISFQTKTRAYSTEFHIEIHGSNAAISINQISFQTKTRAYSTEFHIEIHAELYCIQRGRPLECNRTVSSIDIVN